MLYTLQYTKLSALSQSSLRLIVSIYKAGKSSKNVHRNMTQEYSIQVLYSEWSHRMTISG